MGRAWRPVTGYDAAPGAGARQAIAARGAACGARGACAPCVDEGASMNRIFSACLLVLVPAAGLLAASCAKSSSVPFEPQTCAMLSACMPPGAFGSYRGAALAAPRLLLLVTASLPRARPRRGGRGAP